jgi:hypothetical protein
MPDNWKEKIIMAVWVDEGPKPKPYEGCLVIMNIGQDNISDVPVGEKEKVVEALADAHAGGCAVLYVFDSDVGPMPQPEEFDFVAEMDVVRMGFDILNMRTIQFSPDAEKQRAEMAALKERIKERLNETSLRFYGPVRFCGYCMVGEKKVFLSSTVC